jgi:hypothetical protein
VYLIYIGWGDMNWILREILAYLKDLWLFKQGSDPWSSDIRPKYRMF